MKVNAAIGFLLASVALLLIADEGAAPWRRRLAQVCALLLLLIGGLTLGEYFSGVSFGIDELFLREELGATLTSFPGRMGPNTALCFLLTGSALLMIDTPSQTRVRLTQGMLLLSLFIALAALVGYGYGVIHLVRISWASQMSLHTALAFVVLSLGILAARPRRSLMALFISDTPGGVLLRRMWPQALLLLIILGWLRLEGERAGLYETAFGTALLVLSGIVLLSLLIWRAAWQLKGLEVERRAAAEAERELDARLRVTLRSIGDAVIATDVNGQVSFMNLIAEKLTGWTQTEAQGRSLRDVYHIVNENTRDEVENPVTTVTREGIIVGLANHTVLLAKDGREIPIDDSAAPIRDDHGHIIGAVLVFRDVTERKQTESALARLAAIIESSDDAIVSKDLNGIITSWNKGAETLFGYTAEEVIGKPITILIPPERADEEQQVLRSIRRGEKLDHYETVRQRKDGSPVEISLTISPLRDSTGKIIGASKIARDITPRKRAEEARQKLEYIFNHAGWAVAVVNPVTNRLEMINPAFAAMHGYTVEELLGKPFADTFAPAARAELPQHIAATNELGDYEYEAIHLRKDGTEFPVHTHVTTFRDPAGRVLYRAATFLDLTESKRAEQALRESEERFSKAFKASPMVLTISSLTTGKLIEVNETFVQATGYTRAEALGKTTIELGLWKNPPDREAEMEMVRRIGQVNNLEYVFCTKTGEEIIGLLSAERIEIGGQPFALTVIQDITERKRAEAAREVQLRREQELRHIAEQANRLKDEFLATISHELRTPLNHMLGWVVMLRSGRLTPEKAAAALETIERNVRAQNRLVEDLLDVSRIVSGKMQLQVQSILPAQVLEAAVASARPTAEAKGVRLQVELDARSGHISGDPDRLQQVVWNLLSNAIKFTPPDGQVRVQLTDTNTHVVITVSDTGEGIAPEFLPFIFDHFSQADGSTKRKHGGLGLGLAIVRHLVELHGGEVSVASPGAGQGTTFTVKLPLMPAPQAEVTPQSAIAYQENGFRTDAPVQLDGVRVLVVDDEADSRQLIAAMLTESRADVQLAGSMNEALAILQSWQPDVLISDIAMPNGDGYDLIRTVRQKDGRREQWFPAIALTAYTRSEDRLRVIKAGYQMHVAKPVEPRELLMVVASLAGRLPNG
ncbi:MAG TPA: PAS domain S-box protein [Blastocatellia bacterium]|nr:PAS domain S-box protein [Blastocatellia bacterium]